MNDVRMDGHQTPEVIAFDETGSTVLSGRWLLVARVGWILLVVLSLAAFIMALRGDLSSNQHTTTTNAALSPESAAALFRIGISLDAYAWTSLGIACVVMLVSTVMAVVLFWRRSDDWMALLVGLFLIIYTTSNIGPPINPLNGSTSSPSTFGALLYAILLGTQNAPGVAIPFAVFLLFPSGRFVPRWSRWLFVVSLVWAVAISAAPLFLDGILFLGYPVFIGAVIICMVYRYRRASTPVQRLQTKWVVAGLIVSLLANQAFWSLTSFTSLGQTIYPPLAYVGYQLVLLVVPVTFFIAIQRYRLYGIDTLINRALVYGSLTAVLTGIYETGVLGVQSLADAFTGKAIGQQPIIVVATTLLIGALFRPLRARLQSAVDRRFYRSKYDAAKTLDAFSAVVRHDVDLTELRGRLLEVVAETMQPAHVSLWLLKEPRAPGMATKDAAVQGGEGDNGRI
ncbi:MAG: hypothetical protein ACXVCO_05065 [Ktedonobacterales bacterium]